MLGNKSAVSRYKIANYGEYTPYLNQVHEYACSLKLSNENNNRLKISLKEIRIMNNFNNQQLADATSSFTAFADINLSDQALDSSDHQPCSVEQLTAFGEFATNEDSFPAC